MGNTLPEKTWLGTIGEILVQLRLLEYGVQAAPPIKDSGNDLIAIKKKMIKTVQVKTTIKGSIRVPDESKLYDLLALVFIHNVSGKIHLDNSKIFILQKEEITQKTYGQKSINLHGKEMSKQKIDSLFSDILEKFIKTLGDE